MSENKRFVYVLKNNDALPRFYAGVTSDIRGRLEEHNDGRCPQTSRHRPWRLHVVIAFTDETTAVNFERFLKSGTGRAFATKHFQ